MILGTSYLKQSQKKQTWLHAVPPINSQVTRLPTSVSSVDDLTHAKHAGYLAQASFQGLDSSLFWSTSAQVNFDMRLVNGNESKVDKDSDQSARRTHQSWCEQQSLLLPRAALETMLPQRGAASSLKQHKMEKITHKQPDLLARLEAAEKSLSNKDLCP